MSTDLRELTAAACIALEGAAGDIESLPDCEMPWPEEIEKKLMQHEGLIAALKWAKARMSTEQAEQVKQVYREALPACVESVPMPPLLPETLQDCNQALELIRRARLLDAELDDEIRRQQR